MGSTGMIKTWAQGVGARVDGVEVRGGPFGVGGFAARDFKAGDAMGSIPYSLCLGDADVWAASGLANIGRAVWNALCARPSEDPTSEKWSRSLHSEIPGPDGATVLLVDARYALYLFAIAARAGKRCCGCRCSDPVAITYEETCSCCAECAAAYGCGRGFESIWQPYLRNIPLRHDLTVEWAPRELQWLQGTNLYNATKERFDHMKEWLERVQPALNPGDMTADPSLFTL